MMNYLEQSWMRLCIEHTDNEEFAETCMNRICKLINKQRQKEEREMGTSTRETWKSTDEFSSALKAEAEAKAKLMQELNNRDFDVEDDGLGWIGIALLVLSVALFLWVLLGHDAEAAELDLSSAFTTPDYYTVGVMAGKCYSDHNINMCEDKNVVWHLYAKASYPLTESGFVRWTFAVDHYSAWDGEADINGDTDNQSGTFDYMGTGLEIKF